MIMFLQEEEDESTEGLDDEYKTPDEESSDDETTITEQEKAEGGQDHAAEIENLEKDNILSLDELMAKYGAPSCDSEQVSDEEADEEDVENENEEEDKDDGKFIFLSITDIHRKMNFSAVNAKLGY